MLGQAKHPRVILALCVFMVVAIAAVAVFESSGSSVSGQSLSPTAQVQADYSSHLLNIHSMNNTAIGNDYASNASISFADPNESTGNYTGIAKIETALQADMYVNFVLPVFSQTNSTVKVAGNQATVDSSFLVQGYDTDGNALSAQVNAHVIYIHQGSNWLISYEVWNFNFPPAPPPTG